MQSTINYESMQRYVSPVNPAIFPHLTILLLGIGIFFTAWFFVYEVTSTKLSRDLVKELVIALCFDVLFKVPFHIVFYHHVIEDLLYFSQYF
ncbi:hypothetical protein M8J76_008630 [Diaphorina citri]|nr:hypothetical protein M8J76_008630 [Diaphorina citri]